MNCLCIPNIQIDVAVNAPDAGTIIEFLANEEDTVTVGQDLLKIELGGDSGSGGRQEGGQEPKAPASDDQSTSSDPKPFKSEAASHKESPSSNSPPPSPPPTQKKEVTQPPKQESKPSPPKEHPPPQESPPKQSENGKPESKSTGGETVYGSREERRVNSPCSWATGEDANTTLTGEDEPDAPTYC